MLSMTKEEFSRRGTHRTLAKPRKIEAVKIELKVWRKLLIKRLRAIAKLIALRIRSRCKRESSKLTLKISLS